MKKKRYRLRFLAGLVGALFLPGCTAPAQPPAAPVEQEKLELRSLLFHPAWEDSLGSAVVAVTVSTPDRPVPRLVPRQDFAQLQEVSAEVPLFYHLKVDSAWELEQLLNRLGGIPGQLPSVSVAALPKDMGQLPAAKRKELFIRALLPLVVFHNDAIAASRNRLLQLQQNGTGALGAADRQYLAELSEEYRLDQYDRRLADQADTLQLLLERVDQVPPALVLAQGALESGWGSSRFCGERNSLFGEHTWTGAKTGLVPGGHRQTPRYRLAAFPVIGASIASYMQNLNTHPAYAEFRSLRQRMRRQGKLLEPIALAMGLENYSSRGEDYVGDVLELIAQNQLTRFSGLALVDGLSLLSLDG
jgi:Bax protein